MLKIKDDIEIERLEDFGFKPKYDVNTGEKDIYIKKVEDNDTNICQIIVEAKEYWRDECDFFNPIKKSKYYKLIHIKGELTFETGKKLTDVFFDLISANIVEKVEE